MLLKTSGVVGHKRAHPNLFELLAGASVAVADRRLDAWLRAFAVGLGARSIELCVDPAAMNRPKEGAMERAIGAHAILRILGLPAHRHRRMAAVLDAACLALADALERDRAHAMERLRNQVFSTACSRAGVGLIVARWGGEIEAMNPAAERMLKTKDGLVDGGARLSRPLLLLEEIARRSTARGHERGILSIERPSGKAPFLVGVERAELERPPILPMEPRVVVLVDDPEIKTELCARTVSRLYGLTKAETATVLGVVAGRTTKEIAIRHKVTVGTVRTHLKRLMSKTHTGRQADLLRLFARPGPQLILGQGGVFEEDGTC